MLNRTFGCLPTGNEILYGIILAQIDNIQNEQGKIEDFRFYIDNENTIKIWKKIFSLAKSVDMKKELTTKILSDPNHDFVKIILYIYSMESFIFKDMN